MLRTKIFPIPFFLNIYKLIYIYIYKFNFFIDIFSIYIYISYIYIFIFIKYNNYFTKTYKYPLF
jgi:hypothetical protein